MLAQSIITNDNVEPKFLYKFLLAWQKEVGCED